MPQVPAMRRPGFSLLVLACALAPAAACAAGDAATPGALGTSTATRPFTEVGAFAAIFAGVHVGEDNPYPVTGVVPGAALDLRQHVDRLQLHLEGIPTVAASGSATGSFGRSSASFSLLNATLLGDLDPHHRYRLGIGYQLINLTNVNGTNGDRNQVRIASPIYAAEADLPLTRASFVELGANLVTNLRGNLLAETYLDAAEPVRPERGAEIDYRAAYGWRRRGVTYLAGLRGLSYHTRNTSTGDLVDRNVGAGATFSVRVALGRARGQ